ncbi:MAG: asparagine synthetase B [Gemmatimonadota bacterium]|nr:MAG: asparagine synthetase B [Gemmatimonadota bacterium]
MCGIAGIFHFQGSPADSAGVVPQMLERLARRGPDGTGQWTGANVELGHRRLAILDPSPAGHQPMSSACGRYVISFNGEIYNHSDLARELGLDRSRLRSATDTEILLEGWAKRGVEILPSLVGQFAFAMYDREERTLWLVRDRFGEKPLFYHAAPDRFTFGSSISALLAAPWIHKALDPDSLLELMTMRYVVSPRTILRDISKLRPGHYLKLDAAGVQTRRWYVMPAQTAAPSAITTECVERFDHLLRQATARCLVSDVPVGLFLSNGIDSQTILATGGDEIPSFSYCADAAEPGATQPLNTKIRVSHQERVRDLDSALGDLTEPVGDGVALATWQLVRAARDRATVLLCGHGGDEILGGYRLNKDLIELRTLHALRWLPDALLQRMSRHLNGPRPFFGDGRIGAPASARYLINRPLPLQDLHEMFGEARNVSGCLDTVERLYGEAPPGRGDLDQIQWVMAQTFLTENLMSFADSAGMATSAEIRMPFLDRDLVDFVLTQPATHRVRARTPRTNTKRLLRHWAAGRLPDALIQRKKRGFRSGNITRLLETDEPALRSRILDVAEIREAAPGMERWLSHEIPFYSGAREGAYWTALALGVWYARLDDARSVPPVSAEASGA